MARTLNDTDGRKMSPSAFMRQLRPEYYSDTSDRAGYLLDEAQLAFRLGSITERNETHSFEIFCRKLCERTICPNLKPQTGPEGGGDSKADAETYPVSEETRRLWYLGDPNGGQERWAFAFSAKHRWSEKVRNDVQGLVDTRRGYTKIIFVTSRPARAKDRARIEDELSKKYGLEVTILDRSWIAKEIIDADRKDLAYNYLQVGQVVDDPMLLGPTDYSRKRQLETIEQALKDPDAYIGMERQQVTEALVAAKLSRNLELPRFETEGRFARAIRLAEAHGAERQQLEAQYESIWTGFWWFDDIVQLNASYDAFAARVLPTEHTKILEFLCNLHQLLFNAAFHDLATPNELNLPDRTRRLRDALVRLADNLERPNNSLEAQTFLLMLRVNVAVIQGRKDELTEVWSEFGRVLDRAKNMGEFDADRLVTLIENFGTVAGDNPAYNELIERAAEFVTDRKGEAEGALILLKRASKLDFDKRFDIIRLLGKAVRKLSKKEYADQLIEALSLLSLAYRSAGLYWASRASCLFAAATLVVESEPDSALRVEMVPTLKLWAWISLSLRHIPEFLAAVQILNGCLASLPLSEDSKMRVQEDLQELDFGLAAQLAILTPEEMERVATLPDLLEALGLFTARTALLFVMGHEDVLRADGSLPEQETSEGATKLISQLGSQGLVHQGRGALIVNSDDRQIFQTMVLGMRISINAIGTSTSILAAEAVLGTLEAFFATALEMRIFPSAEEFRIELIESDTAKEPTFTLNQSRLEGELIWPSQMAVTDFEHQKLVGDAIFQVVALSLAATCVIHDPEETLRSLFENDLVHERISFISLIGNSHHRFLGKYVTRLSDWDEHDPQLFAVSPARTKLNLILPPHSPEEDGLEMGPEHRDKGIVATSHNAVTVRSIINVHLWDAAQWTGTLYITPQNADDPMLPIMGLTFRNGDAAKQIFEGWRERFGGVDTSEEIYIAIARKLPNESSSHYKVMISSNLDLIKRAPSNANFVIASRHITMTPSNDVNLERFLAQFRRRGAYYLIPAAWSEGQTPLPFYDLPILKRRLTVREASEIKEGEQDYMALGPKHRGNKA